MTRIAAFAAVAVLAGFVVHALAQVRPDVRQTVTPMGTSSSNGVSFAWFYESNERAVYVCRTGQGGADGVDCKARATLP